MKKLAIFLTAAAFLVPVAVRAEGFVSAFACGTVPPHAKFDVEVLDNTAPVMRLREVVVKHLIKRGFGVSSDAPLRLMIDPENGPGMAPQEKENLSRIGSNDDTTLGGESQLGQTLQRLNEQHLLKQSETPGNGMVRIAIIINRKSNGNCLWEGEVRYQADGADFWEIAVLIAPRLVDAIGKPMSNASFHLH